MIFTVGLLGRQSRLIDWASSFRRLIIFAIFRHADASF